jgi:hypothetical protein
MVFFFQETVMPIPKPVQSLKATEMLFGIAAFSGYAFFAAKKWPSVQQVHIARNMMEPRRDNKAGRG